MLDPVAEQEGIVLVKITVVEYQQKLRAVRIEPLDGVRYAGWKIPKIADADVIDEIAPVAGRPR